ncbi:MULTISPECIES: hypothetical protein [unclassified Streptomyces]|uniref:hypothetical protein n=1 Tax=unclassified Streptomyces TaxID=2593676 RepID=UPI0038705351
MHRTTPPRPVDITQEFPELGPPARTAVRLHPRPGEPAVGDSSVGGPLLWPRDEPWPTCPEHAGPWYLGFTPDEVREGRRVRPVEDEAACAAPGVVHPQSQEPTRITIGRGCTMQIHTCERSSGHTPLQVMQ